jgi:NTE family protein
MTAQAVSPLSAAQQPGREVPARRRGLVLGGGGVLGAAWMVGSLVSLEEAHGFDVRDCEFLVGTSAGSVLAALLGSGVSVTDLYHHQLGRAVTTGPLAGFSWDYDHATGASRPSVPRFGPGSARLVTGNLSRLRHLPPTAVLSGLLPVGRGSLARVGHLVEAVAAPGEWAANPGTIVVAMDYETGRRVPFGHPTSPPASLAEAVMASCAIPGWYSPVEINGRRYVDGGACSATSVDLLADLDLDEVFVVAPMVSFAVDRPDSLLSRLERRWRVQVTKRCLRESAKVHRSGTEVTILGPGPADLNAMGGNVMDPSRRLRVLTTAVETSQAALQSADHAPLDDAVVDGPRQLAHQR